MQSPIPESRAADAAQLSAQVAEFERKGGAVKEVPGFTYQPIRPERIPPDPHQALISELRAMARRGCSRRYTAMCLDMTPGRAGELAKKNGIRFRGNL